MKIIHFVALYALLTGYCYKSNAQSFSRRQFYSAMASADTKQVEQQIDLLKNSTIADKPAFEGALLMKKAGLVHGAGKKLNLFNGGRKKLEAAITDNNSNAEYRFLRLMIQEHAPKILGYRDDLEKDSAYIRESYKKLPAEVKEAISNYSKNSKILNADNF